MREGRVFDARGKESGNFFYSSLFCSLVPRPYLRERVWWHSADSLGFINFLERNFSPPIALQKTQSVVQHWKFLATSARWHSTFLALFLACKLVISSQLCLQQSYEFLMKPEESAGHHLTLSSWSGDKTTCCRALYSVGPITAQYSVTQVL